MTKKRRTKEDVVLEQAIMNTDLWHTWPGPLTQSRKDAGVILAAYRALLAKKAKR
jgi:hypothetical protein